MSIKLEDWVDPKTQKFKKLEQLSKDSPVYQWLKENKLLKLKKDGTVDMEEGWTIDLEDMFDNYISQFPGYKYGFSFEFDAYEGDYITNPNFPGVYGHDPDFEIKELPEL